MLTNLSLEVEEGFGCVLWRYSGSHPAARKTTNNSTNSGCRIFKIYGVVQHQDLYMGTLWRHSSRTTPLSTLCFIPASSLSKITDSGVHPCSVNCTSSRQQHPPLLLLPTPSSLKTASHSLRPEPHAFPLVPPLPFPCRLLLPNVPSSTVVPILFTLPPSSHTVLSPYSVMVVGVSIPLQG